MNRWKAAAIHLSISLILGTSIGALLYFLWFPAPYFTAAGASILILVLVGVDLAVGPLLTLLVVTPGKSTKALRFDLTVIALVQSLAFAYGVHAIAEARPVFVVAAVDRLVLVPASEISDADLAQARFPEFRSRSWTGPRLAGVVPPRGPKSMEIVDQTMNGGKDLDALPQYYVPYDQALDMLLRHSRSISSVKSASDSQRRDARTYTGSDLPMAIPMQRGDHDFTAVLSPTTHRPVLVLPIDPW